MSVSIDFISLAVTDYDQAIAFYRDALQLYLEDDFPFGAERWVTMRKLDKQGVALQFERLDQATSKRMGGIHSTDIQADYVRILQHGGVFDHPPKKEAWGTGAGFTDPFGNWWYLNSEVA